MRILHTPVRFYPFVGGVEKYVLELAVAQYKQGDDLTVVCANDPASSELETVKGVIVKRLPFIAKVANTNITPSLLVCLLREKFNIIHTHIPTPWSADLSALASFIKRKPLVITYHNDIVKAGGIEKLIADVYNATFLRLLFWRAARIVITQPRYLEYSKQLGKHAAKVVVIPLGVSKPKTVRNVKRIENEIFFLSVLDKHHEYKGLDLLIEALGDLKNDFPNVHLTIGGKGELIDKYQQQSKALGLEMNVTFLGYVSEDALALHYATAAVFVLPSINNLEGFGIVALEALTYGTPVVTTDLAGSSAYIEEYNAGVIIPSNDKGALVCAVRKLLADPASARMMGENGRKHVLREFSWAKIARRFDDLYKECLEERSHK